MPRRLCLGRPRLALATVCALATAATAAAAVEPSAFGDAPPSTTERTLVPRTSQGFRTFRLGRGDGHRVRRGAGVRPLRGRARRRRSLAFFAQLTDPQITDEASPARFEFLRGAGGHLRTAFRPQESLSTQTFDLAVRSVNRHRRSPVPAAGGRRARLGFALMTGDLSENHQANEVAWGVRVLEGGRVDPFSGRRISATNPCPGATGEQVRTLNRLVERRAYTGVQDYADWPAQASPARRLFWDPSRPPPGGGPYARFPRYPGLLDRAQQPFQAEGLDLRWFAVRGNHDALSAGRYSPTTAFPAGIATGCRKAYPPAVGPGSAPVNRPWSFLRAALPNGRLVPPDQGRRFLSAREFKRLHGRADRGHGFGLVRAGQRRASRGAASYYAFSPRRGLRFVALDTIAEGAGPNGNIDHPQYRWLARELDRSSSFELTGSGRLRRDGDRDRLIVVYGHHTLETMNNPAVDEFVAPCSGALVRCDLDPRRSTPIHRATRGRANIRALLLRYPNVILYVGGHVHRNRVVPFFRRDRRGGFWQVATVGHLDAPQQSRLIELMDNRDRTLSVFGTLLHHSAPGPAPPSGRPAGGLGHAQLGSISRVLAANAGRARPGAAALGPAEGRLGRNVELVLRDPRRLWRR